MVTLAALPAMGQVPDPAPGTSQTQAAPKQTSPAPSSAPAPQTTTAQARRPPEPDYPQPRTLTIGFLYWFSGPGTNPSIYSGSQAIDYTTYTYTNETLVNLGRAHRSPGIQAYIPITRTGELRFEYIRTQGDGNQIAPNSPSIFGTSFTQGDYLSTQYTMNRAKLYLDDLLFPHKFPVAKFRLKSLWEVQWVRFNANVVEPFASANGVPQTATGTEQVILPAFGMAAEYALTRHMLLRADIAGFGIPHRSDIAEANALVSYRRGAWEVMGGAKWFHFKTSPNSTEYVSATEMGPFVSLLWHWSL